MIKLGRLSEKGKEIILEEKENGCLECITHCKDSCGYTRVFVNGKHERLFRILYEKENGDIPEGFVVRHKCDNPYCCNVNHLEIGTPKDNSNDRELRGRGNKGKNNTKIRGKNNKQSKLNEERVLFIYNSSMSLKELSEKFGVSKSLIHYIKTERLWAWLTNPKQKTTN